MAVTSPITIYHNPGCSKSRKTLELIEARGIKPRIVQYLQDPPSTDTLRQLANKLGVPLQEIMRKGEAEYTAAGDTVPLHDEQNLAEWINQHPRVLQRPIVVNEETGQAAVGRPPENVLDVLSDG